MNKKLIYIVFLGLIITSGCEVSRNEFGLDQVRLIKSIIWNLELPDTIINNSLTNQSYSLFMNKFNHMPIFFLDDNLHMESIDGIVGKCEFMNDSILIKTSYIKAGVASSVHVTDTLFLGKIVQLDKERLTILRINDQLFSYLLGDPEENKFLKFYNDSLKTRYETKFSKISISSSPCYGYCPSFNAEIDSLGDLHYNGGIYSPKQGLFKGILHRETMDSIKHLLTSALANQAAFKFYGFSDDATYSEMKIVLERNDTLIIDGNTNGYNYRLWQIYNRIRLSIIVDSLEKDESNFNFLSNKYILKK